MLLLNLEMTKGSNTIQEENFAWSVTVEQYSPRNVLLHYCLICRKMEFEVEVVYALSSHFVRGICGSFASAFTHVISFG
jgi:hypothetical protein